MNTIRASGECDVETVVNQQPRRTAARDLCGARDQFVEHSRAQVLFTNLKERDLRSYRSFGQLKDTREAGVGRSCLTRCRAARYRVEDWSLLAERHRFLVVDEVRFGFATR